MWSRENDRGDRNSGPAAGWLPFHGLSRGSQKDFSKGNPVEPVERCGKAPSGPKVSLGVLALPLSSGSGHVCRPGRCGRPCCRQRRGPRPVGLGVIRGPRLGPCLGLGLPEPPCSGTAGGQSGSGSGSGWASGSLETARSNAWDGRSRTCNTSPRIAGKRWGRGSRPGRGPSQPPVPRPALSLARSRGRPFPGRSRSLARPAEFQASRPLRS